MNKIWFTDEAHFDLYGYVNRQKWRFWRSKNPNISIAKPLHSKRVTVWCAISGAVIIGPYFMEETITSDVYIMKFLDPFIEESLNRNLLDGFYFQQDGATAHRTQDVFDRLSQWFGTNIIALDAPCKAGGGLDWRSNSPDLTPPDYFLWSYLKDNVYQNKPKNIEELKNNIKTTIEAISSDIIHNVVLNFITRIRSLIKSNGSYFENMFH